MGKISGKPLLLPSTLPVSYKFSCKRIDQEQWSITKHHESTKKRDPNKHRLTKLFHVASQHTGWWFQPLWKILVSWDHYSQYMESHKIYVPNHQPAYIYIYILSFMGTPNVLMPWQRRLETRPAPESHLDRCRLIQKMECAWLEFGDL